eukprot:47631-Pelagomonas_calceolata.AAC.2
MAPDLKWRHLAQRLGPCLWQTADATSAVVQASLQREHIFWTCPCTQATVGALVRDLHDPALVPPTVWVGS